MEVERVNWEASDADIQRLYGEPVDRSHPLFHYDLRRCNGCGACVAAAGKAGCAALSMRVVAGRSRMVPGGGRWKDSSCRSCGECAQACPAGAIRDVYSDAPPDQAEAEWIATHCPYCAEGCPIRVGVAGPLGRVVGVKADGGSGGLCLRGRYARVLAGGGIRRRSPLIRCREAFTAISWDEAVERIVEEITRVGCRKVAMVASSDIALEDLAACGDLARQAFHAARLYALSPPGGGSVGPCSQGSGINATGLSGVLGRAIKGIEIAGAVELTRGIRGGGIEGLYLIGVDPIRRLAGIVGLLDDLAKMKAVVLHERYIGAVRDYADIIVPVAGWHEDTGHFLDGWGRIQSVARVVKSGARSDRQVLGQVACQLGVALSEPDPCGGGCPSEPVRDCPPSEIFGCLNLVLGGHPLFGTGIEVLASAVVQSLGNFDALRVHPSDGIRFDVGDGDNVRIESAGGAIKTRAVYDTRTPRGCAGISNVFPWTCASLLWPADRDLSKPVAVRLYPARNQDQGESSRDQIRCIHFFRK